MWQSITAVFASLLRFINRWTPGRVVSQSQQNPHPFGTTDWREFEAAQASDHELMVLKISDLEAQVQQTSELVQSLEALASHQDTVIHDLRLQNKNLRDGPDPEVFERIWEKIHKPMEKRAPPGGPGPGSPGPSSAPVAPAAESARTSAAAPESSQAAGAGQDKVKATRSRPLTLAEELEGAFDDDSEDESEEPSS